MDERLEGALQLHLMEEEAMSRVRVNRSSMRPDNTRIQYCGRQLEFFEWNKGLNYPDEQVSEAKMVLFLTHISSRPMRSRGRKAKRSQPGAEQDEIKVSVGYHSVAAYANALMDVWRVQHELGQNTRLPIRPNSVKELLKQKKIATVQQEDSMFQDRGKGTMIDCVDGKSLAAVSMSFFAANTKSGLKHRADNLMSLALCARGDNMRSLKLSTVGLVDFPSEGVRGAKLFRCAWRKSKKNQYGNVEQTTMLRHKDAERCPIGALAMYWFYRWHIGDEPWPDFSSPELWYNVCALKGSSPVTPMLYSHQYVAIKKQHELLGIQTTVRTQNGRKVAATAENFGARGESVDKQGHWAVKSRNGAYANNVVPWDSVRVLAGFGPESNRYYLSRDLLDPPSDLKQMVFPLLETSKSLLAGSRASGVDIAGSSFLDLLEYMRCVLLQDAAVLSERAEFKTHMLYQHQVFKTTSFTDFREEVLRTIADTATPESLVVSQAMPLVAESLVDIRKDAARVHEQLRQINACLGDMKKTMENASPIEARAIHEHVSNNIRLELQQALLGAARALSSDGSHPAQASSEVCQAQASTEVSYGASPPNASSLPQSAIPLYRMSRQLYSVQQAWTEWKYGIDSAPSVEYMETLHGSKWRASNTDTQFFIRRKPLYDAIKLAIQAGETEDEAIALFEDVLKKKRGLRALTEGLKIKLQTFPLDHNGGATKESFHLHFRE